MWGKSSRENAARAQMKGPCSVWKRKSEEEISMWFPSTSQIGAEATGQSEYTRYVRCAVGLNAGSAHGGGAIQLPEEPTGLGCAEKKRTRERGGPCPRREKAPHPRSVA